MRTMSSAPFAIRCCYAPEAGARKWRVLAHRARSAGLAQGCRCALPLQGAGPYCGGLPHSLFHLLVRCALSYVKGDWYGYPYCAASLFQWFWAGSKHTVNAMSRRTRMHLPRPSLGSLCDPLLIYRRHNRRRLC